ncbi:ATP-dependent helicase HepA [Thiorhodovibrio winogradskyi]|uniref:ATP-dependent helicase HepA n=1 Tax=Thiorhodovibrio winogradskyi TaxID=77007 RepID=A0ABZ0S8A5_9GAMM|nr:DEAD/DEAH box helicase [Thiorhodovibrio winogradskyi]
MIPVNLIATFQNQFDLRSFERGMRYFRNGRVQSLNIDTERGTVNGRVRGSGNQTYVTLVQISAPSIGALELTGQCSCPVGLNCKHVVALLFAAEKRLREGAANADEGQAVLPSPAAAPLPRELLNWLAGAEQLQQRLSTDNSYCLLFRLELATEQHRPALFLTAEKTRCLIDGGFGKREPFSLLGRSQAGFITPADHRIMALTESVTSTSSGRLNRHRLRIAGPGSADLLRQLALSTRAYWDSGCESGDHPMQWQSPLRGTFRWELQDDATLGIRLDGGPPGTLVLPCEPPCWLDPSNGHCGLLETDLDPATATLLVQAPAVPSSAAEPLRQRLNDRLPNLKLPQPPAVERRRVEDLKPVPMLELWSENREVARELRHWGMQERPTWVDGASLSFRYGKRLIPHDLPHSVVEEVRDGIVVECLRDRERERDAIIELGMLGFSFEHETHGRLSLDEPDRDWLQFVTYDLPRLRENGWVIIVNPSFRYQLADVEDWEFQIEDEAQDAWFSLSLGVEVDGQRVDLLPLLVELMHNYRDSFSAAALANTPDDTKLPIKLPDGRYAMMPLARLRPLLTTLIELYDDKPLDKDGRLRLAHSQRGELAQLAQALPDTRWSGAEKALEWGRRLRDFEGIAPVEPPPGLHAELRPYQRKGLDWLQFLRDFELGGVLADDMGLGKTIQCLTHLLVEKSAGRADRPSLVVAPTSLMFNWRREAERFTPELKVLLLQGADRRARFAEIPEHDLILTTYPLLPRDYQELAAHQYHLLILDEAQAVKNPRSKAAEAVRIINARHRLCLTGTPLENHLGELWALIDFLMPGLLGDDRRFKRLFRNPIEKFNDQPRAEQLRRRIAPFMLRRTKEEVAPELPPKTEILREVPLAGAQRDLYETLRLAMHERVRKEVERKGLSRSGIVILDALLKLRQVCCDPRLLSLESARKVKTSAKLEMLLELLADLRDEGRRILLFSQFASMLDLIEGELGARHKMRPEQDYVKLTGRTQHRDVLVDRFQSGEVPLFLISLKAGGSGLNLTAADTVIHYDPWWNPAAERQATDRAHRIGQDKPVFVYKLLTEGTVEQKVAELQARKQALADAMLTGGAGATSSLSASDLDMLFAPIAEAEN